MSYRKEHSRTCQLNMNSCPEVTLMCRDMRRPWRRQKRQTGATVSHQTGNPLRRKDFPTVGTTVAALPPGEFSGVARRCKTERRTASRTGTSTASLRYRFSCASEGIGVGRTTFRTCRSSAVPSCRPPPGLAPMTAAAGRRWTWDCRRSWTALPFGGVSCVRRASRCCGTTPGRCCTGMAGPACGSQCASGRAPASRSTRDRSCTGSVFRRRAASCARWARPSAQTTVHTGDTATVARRRASACDGRDSTTACTSSDSGGTWTASLRDEFADDSQNFPIVWTAWRISDIGTDFLPLQPKPQTRMAVQI